MEIHESVGDLSFFGHLGMATLIIIVVWVVGFVLFRVWDLVDWIVARSKSSGRKHKEK